jgi:hypothetical protein
VGITSGTGGLDVIVATDNRGTYAGDHYLYWSWVAPFPGQPFTLGAGGVGDENAFSLATAGTDTFAPTPCGTVSCSSSDAFPGAFGTILAYNGWHPEVAIATIVAGDSTPHNVRFYLSTGGLGGQFGEPGWTFIPGPNNPACTAAGTCTLTATDIESARQDHYHGCVPPNQSAGAVVTCEASSSGTEVKVNGGSALTTSNQTGVLPYLCADTSGSGTAQSCTTTPGFTPQLGNCLSYTTTTDSGSSLTLNMNGSGAYGVQIPSPSGWVGVYAAGQIIPGTTYTACYYLNGDDTPLWNVQQQGTIGSPAQGGTGIDTSASTGIAQVASGSWSVSTVLANGTTGTTQTVGDSTTKLATDAFVSANAAPPVGNVTNETTSWSLVANNIYRFTGSGASNATTPATTGATGLISFVNAGSANVTVVTGTPTLVCLPSSCIVPPTASAFINTDGVDQYAIISNASGPTIQTGNSTTPCNGAAIPAYGKATCVFTLSSANLLYFDNTPATYIHMISAPGAGLMVNVTQQLESIANYIAGGTPYNAPFECQLVYDANLSSGVGPAFFFVDTSQTTNQVAFFTSEGSAGVASSLQVNSALDLSSCGPITTGNGTVVVTMEYQIIPVQ